MNLKAKFSLSAIQTKFGDMLNRALSPQAYLNRVVYPKILQVQMTRWQTEGASQNSQWKPLNPVYARRKRTMFASYPGSGSKMLIATNALVDAMTAKDVKNHFKLVTEKRLIVGTTLYYAKYVSDARDISKLSDKTVREIADGFGQYLLEGTMK